MNAPYTSNSCYDYSDPVMLAACYLFLDAIVRPFSGQGCDGAWQADHTDLDGPLIKPWITAMVVPDEWIREIALYLAILAETDGIPHVVDPCDKELDRFLARRHRAMPQRVSQFTPAKLDLMGQLRVIAQPVAPKPWIASPLATLTFDPECNGRHTPESMFPPAWLGALRALKWRGTSVMILCNDLAALPDRVLSEIDRRCVVDGLRIDSWILRKVVSYFVSDGDIAPLNPWSEVDRVVSPGWLTDYISKLERAPRKLN